ncbi:MAG: DUF5069 domain-containing protein [Candidatus Eremiobacteraeota bacterium]|nr:DUF5069 domain-containing protein [Candidatus Eremiobacteraeota bacterium]
MDALDLTKHPPRSPREELDGLVNLPRTIDKLRAKMPEGKLGEYAIEGFSQMMLDAIGITEEQLYTVVVDAKTDADVAAWLREHAKVDQYATFSEKLKKRRVDQARDPVAFAERYPVIKTRPDLEYMFDVLDADDAEMFAAR